MRVVYLYILLIIGFGLDPRIEAAPVFSYSDTEALESVPAHTYLEVWKDDTKQATIWDVLRTRPEFLDFNFQKIDGAGYSTAIYWVRLRIVNASSAERSIFLEATDPQQYLDFYKVDFDKAKVLDTQLIGSYRPVSLQRMKHRFPLMELKLDPGVNTFVFRMGALSVTFPYYLWTQKDLVQAAGDDLIVLSVLFGSFGILAIYNVLLGITTKRREYFLYFGYLSSFILLQLFLTGAGRYYFGDVWTIVNRGLTLWISLVTFFSIQFLVSFLDLGEKKHPKVAKVLNVYSAVVVLFAAASLWNEYLALKVFPVLLSVLIFMFYAGTKQALSGYKPARLYMMGWVWFFLGTIFVLCYYSGLFSDAKFVSWLMLGGASLQMIFFSLAIGDRLRAEAEVNLKDLSILLEKQVAESKSREHAFQQLGKVFYPHQLQKMEAGQALESTMPVGPGKACVLQLDIVNSSQIQHIKRKEFLTGFLKRCQGIMMSNYDPETMQADAYRIKEMGDGFLCSVGYPFRVPLNCNPADHAVMLSERFLKAFREEVKDLGYHSPIHCAIGIAVGEIEAYYPNTGTKEYDLYGKGIILASRYENLRKSLFQEVNFDILILQDEVYVALSEEKRAQFKAFNLLDAKISVRDDPGATYVYYQVFSDKISHEWEQAG